MSPRRPPVPRAGARSSDRATDRPAERPASAARPRSTPAGPVRRRTPTLRGVLFAGVAVVGLASVLGPLRGYAAQRSELSSLREDVAARQARVADLQRQVQRWDDPAYVSAQARGRLHYVMPGETGYVVLDPPASAAPPDSSGSSGSLPAGRRTGAASEPGGTSWTDRLQQTLGLDDGDGLLGPSAPATRAARP